MAARLYELVASGLTRAYPYKSGLVLHGDQDSRPPRDRHPIFYGCFDWHSAVHSHWSVARLRRLFPDAAWAGSATAHYEQAFTSKNVAAEMATLASQSGFELPYGIAWLLQLCAELSRGDERAREWHDVMAPMQTLAVERFAGWLHRLPCPTRDGQHSQSAFSMGFALDAAAVLGADELARSIRAHAEEFYGEDEAGPIGYEPSAYDFLSPCLAEADLMARIREPDSFKLWLNRFLPAIDLLPVTPADRADGKLAHFDGLNFSRAWMLERIASALPPAYDRCDELRALATQHGAAGMRSLDAMTYMGTHWVGSFALYWLTG